MLSLLQLPRMSKHDAVVTCPIEDDQKNFARQLRGHGASFCVGFLCVSRQICFCYCSSRLTASVRHEVQITLSTQPSRIPLRACCMVQDKQAPGVDALSFFHVFMEPLQSTHRQLLCFATFTILREREETSLMPSAPNIHCSELWCVF
jgi:hypothetical protein